jgi:FG-GAP repeat
MRARQTVAVSVPDGGGLVAPIRHERRLARVPWLLAGLAIAALATVALTTLATPAPSGYLPSSRHARSHQLFPRVSPGLAAAASASIGASEQAYWPVRRGDSLLTKGGGIASTFSAAGARLRAAQGTLGLSLAGIGRGQRLQRIGTVAPSRQASQIVYRHGSISEFYRNGPSGLEQGFTVRSRPQAGAGSLVLALGLRGSLVPERVGSQILFRTHKGVTALRYGQLAARDATGRPLPAVMQIRNGRLELRIDDGNARYPLTIDPFVQQGPKLTGGGETGKGLFGFRVALSANGNTALIGAPSDNGRVGAAWVFTRSGSTWTQQGEKLTGGEESGKAEFGKAVALSADGNTALIGGPADSSGTGAAWVFAREGETWTQQGPKLTAGGEVGAGHFSISVALSQDGNTALIGGGGDHGEVGAAWVFTRSGSTWEQQGEKLTGGEESGKGHFGFSVALSADGNNALIGGVADNGEVGAAWVFTRSGETWTQQGEKLTGGEESGNAEFGESVALSGAGDTALIGGPADSLGTGAAWVFLREGETWAQQGPKLTAGGEVGAGHFGFGVSLSEDGNTALIGGGGDNSEVGAAWLFTRTGSAWEQHGEKLTGSEESGKGHFVFSVALSADAGTGLIGGLADKTEIGAAWVFASPPVIPPTVVTGSASSITQTSATLNATVNPNGETVSDCHFEYGISPSYGSSVPCTSLPGSGASPVSVSAPLTGLTPNTPYHFQIVATNPTGTSAGADQTFTTAEAPEYGRCVKLAKGVKGKFGTAACTSAATAEKFAFEWAPGPGPKAKFTTAIKVLTVATLETVTKKQVVCTGQASTGEYTGSKTVGNVIVTFTGCAMGASECTSGGAEEGEVVTKTLEGVLGVEKTSTEGPVKNKIALDLFPVGKTGPLMEFNCGLTAVSVQGSVLYPVKTNKMLSLVTLKYTESSGKQKPEKFEGAPKDVLETAFGEAAAEQSGLKLTTIESNEEKIEINTVV